MDYPVVEWSEPWCIGATDTYPSTQLAFSRLLYSHLETSFLFLTQNEPSGNPKPWGTPCFLPRGSNYRTFLDGDPWWASDLEDLEE
jgi:hypothetical protein